MFYFLFNINSRKLQGQNHSKQHICKNAICSTWQLQQSHEMHDNKQQLMQQQIKALKHTSTNEY